MQSFVEIRDAVAGGRVRPEEAIAKCFDAVAERDGNLLAFEVLAEREAALAQAKTAKGPLAGIGVGIKDIFDTHDLPTGYGSPIYEGFRPRVDAGVVALMRAAGATVVGKTVTTEYAFLEPAKTRNPRDPAHTPGGSSSGSAAAVAAGMVPAATGTQTGGSIIRPAAYCGVAGYKPSFRMVPATGMKTFAWTLDTVGFFAAGAADVAAFAAAVTGRDLEARPLEAEGLRIGLMRTAVWNEASEDMRAAVEKAAGLAADAGAEIFELDEPGIFAEAREEAHGTIQGFEASRGLAGDLDLHGARMSPLLRDTLVRGRAVTPDEYDAARAVARRARRASNALFSGIDAVLTPATPGAAPKGLASTGSPVFNKLWTLTGNPCIGVPGLADAAGLPLGVQVVAGFGADTRALSVAAWLEAHLST